MTRCVYVLHSCVYSMSACVKTIKFIIEHGGARDSLAFKMTKSKKS